MSERLNDVAKQAAYACLLALAAMFLVGCATNAATGKQDLMLVSTEDEQELGRKEHEVFVRTPGLYLDEEVQGYVQRVGMKIVDVSDRKDIEYRFFVLNQPEVNAFALPNGNIYVTRGLLAFLGSEAELAAVLAHEVVHVAARHGAQLVSSAKVAGAMSTVLGVIAGVAVGAATGNPDLALSAMDATSGVSAVTGVLVLGNYSREHELEADQLGTRYLARAGYPQQAMVGVLGALKSIQEFDEARLDEGSKKKLMYHPVATHPEYDERIEKVDVAAGDADDQETIGLQNAYIERTARLVFEPFDAARATGNRQNTWINREALFQIYLHPGWKIVDSSKDTISLEKAADGVSAKFRLLPPQPDQDPEKFFSGKQVGATAVEDLQNMNHVYHKAPSYSAFADLETPDGRRAAYVAVLFHEKYTVLMEGTCEDVAWMKTHRYVFGAQLNLTKVLTEEEYAHLRVKRIQTVKAKEGDRYAALAKAGPLGAAGEDYLRLLNRQYPTGEPAADQPIKIVVADP